MAQETKLDLSDLEIMIPDDTGVEGLDPDAIGGSMVPPQPGTYLVQVSFGENTKSEDYFKMGTNKEPNAKVLSMKPNLTIIDAHNSREEESMWMGRVAFNQYMSTKINKGKTTSLLTDWFVAAGVDKATRDAMREAGGLGVVRQTALELIGNQQPAWCVLGWDWLGESQRVNPDNPEKKLYIQRQWDHPELKNVPQGTEGLTRDKETGRYPTEQVYVHTFADGEKEEIHLRARLSLTRWVLPPK